MGLVGADGGLDEGGSDMTFSEYQSLPGINASAIKAGAESMLAMRYVMSGGGKDETPSMRWGSLVHSAILEPDRFFRESAIWEGGVKRGKEWDTFKAENADRDIISRDEFADAVACANVVHANQEAHRLIEQSRHEETVTWEGESYGQAKARLDGLGRDFVLEIKTARNIAPAAFGRQVVGDLGYDLQIAWYSEGASGLPVKVVAVRNEQPYDVAVYSIPRLVYQLAGRRARDIAARYRACEAAGEFPGVSPRETELLLPEWYSQQDAVYDVLDEIAASQL